MKWYSYFAPVDGELDSVGYLVQVLLVSFVLDQTVAQLKSQFLILFRQMSHSF